MVSFKNIIQVVALAALVSAAPSAPSGKPVVSVTVSAGSATSSPHAVAGQPITIPPRPAKPQTTLDIPPSCTV
ncbi:hypothetical protein Unana1_00518 [Umbelopsis nana]